MIRLATERGEIEIRPELGAGVTVFRWDGRDVLRPTPADADDVLQTGNFVLAPFCNRIRDGVFNFEGRQVLLAPNLGDHPHALHGQAWRQAWRVVTQTASSIELAYDHAPGDWPWRYEAAQTISLTDTGLVHTATLTNTDVHPMPAGLGFHPAFPAPPGTHLRADVRGVWMIDDEVMPTDWRPMGWGPDWRTGVAVESGVFVDNSYTDWGGVAVLSGRDRPSVRLEGSSNCPWLHVFAPVGGGFVCVEPVSNRPDPFNGEDSGIQVLAAGEAMTVSMRLTVD
ncbi:aldose 1-epimerase [Caulobacter sp. NIBR2454]|uniref:aldose 1-epimerase n=1 Tax=Caulobacter sp. NIBR2454 TaxID=3015996 RepID=UPI0022B74832|nr:aldose 1-epimerase [Caulobacter sp. NIBR2454]